MCVTEWLSVREGRRRAETESTETSERELKMRRMNRVRLVRVLLFQPKWCILHPFFFFRISTCIGGFSQNRWFWIQPNQHELVQFRTSRKKKKKKKTGCFMNAQAVASLTRCRVGRGCGGHFAVSMHPR